ncbi:Holliday junction ATP-dependent DNA helicase RuvA [Clostridium sp. N3C]|uniref:Holliday junction branch migration protein RuvA n=1 Tax=Clostridium sp. N3C TaxID=1776758 RepID=UPI00092E0B62|nr:Holliday junction branch migration protein RuvA [Clostridium sp. N3C]SCN21485.1 Holliday junction ATP-dependent DNA helicase RuvA [Clostridium sp. N3C]
MYEYIKGEYKGFYKDYVVIENNGIGYKIFVPGSTLTKLPKIDEEVLLYTYQMVREDFIGLYGFSSRDELEMFLLLININGVGAKAALSIQSILDVETLQYSIATGDEKALCRAPGVGKKIAQRIILELQDKMKKLCVINEEGICVDSKEQNSSFSDALEALISLGYSEKEAVAVLKNIDVTASLETVIKDALRQLMN